MLRWLGIAALHLAVLAATPAAVGQTMVSMDNDAFTVSTPTHEARAGPQDAVTFPIRIVNHRDADVRFEFSLPYETEEELGGFHVVLPEPLVLRADMDLIASLQVYTPFHNGYVDDDIAFIVRIQSALADRPETLGDFTEFGLLVRTSGWYMPAPAAAMAALAILAAAFVMGRARRH